MRLSALALALAILAPTAPARTVEAPPPGSVTLPVERFEELMMA